MFKSLYLLTIILLTSCSGLYLFSPVKKIEINHQLVHEGDSFGLEVDEKLHKLYCYYLMATKNLKQFDESIRDSSLQQLQKSTSYLSLLAAKTQIDATEKEILEIQAYLKRSNQETSKNLIFKNKIVNFSKRSHFSKSSMNNLLLSMKLPIDQNHKHDEISFHQEYSVQSKLKLFQHYEKNIEHLSHILAMDLNPRHKLNPKKVQIKKTFHLNDNFPTTTFDALDWAPQGADRPLNRMKSLMKKTTKGMVRT
jgi:hypothetical protein